MGKSKIKKKQNPKLEIKFDPVSRRDFLTGFHKRKLEKKEVYKAKLEKKLAAEKQRIKAEAKKSLGRTSSHSVLPEVEKIIGLSQTDLDNELKTKSESFYIGSKTVTISSLDDIRPTIDFNELNDKGSDSDEDKNLEEDSPKIGPSRNMKTLLGRATNQLLQQSKIFKASQKLKFKGKQKRKRKRDEESSDTKVTGKGRIRQQSNSKHNKKKKLKNKSIKK